MQQETTGASCFVSMWVEYVDTYHELNAQQGPYNSFNILLVNR